MTTRRLSRRDVAVHILIAWLGPLAVLAVLIAIFDRPTPIARVTILAIVTLLCVALVLTARWLIRRRSGGPTPRLAKADRRSLKEALEGTGRLPPAADESWRPFLHEEATGQSFSALWVQYTPIVLVSIIASPMLTGEADPSDVDVRRVLVALVVAAAISAVGAWAQAAAHRFQARNAVTMLDQLDARLDGGTPLRSNDVRGS